MKRFVTILIIACLISTVALSHDAVDGSFDIPEGAYKATFIDDRDNIAVIKFTGNYNRNLVDGTFNSAARAVVAQEFYEHHSDEYDFLVIFSDFEFETGDALAFYSGVANETQGLGKEIFDYSERFGSNGELKGIIDMAAISRYELNPLTALSESRADNYNLVLSTLAHETLHQWAAFTKIPELQGRDNGHWSFFLDTDGSLMYGNDWVDNEDGTFTSSDVYRKFFSPLDLYLMGMNGPETVPDMFVISPTDDEYDHEDLPETGVTISGTRSNYSIEDFIAVHGERIPSSKEENKELRYAFIYLTSSDGALTGDSDLELSSNSIVSDAVISQLNQIQSAFSERFAIMTGGKGIANVFPKITPVTSAGTFTEIEDDSALLNDLDKTLAIDWLLDQQQSTGSWQDKSTTAVRDTVTTIETLKAEQDSLNNTSTFENAESWLNDQTLENEDSRARLTLANYGQDQDYVQLLDSQNSDGGWGLSDRYISNSVDTALVLYALSMNEERFLSAANGNFNHTEFKQAKTRAKEYLLASQNNDKSWSVSENSSGSISVTTQVLRALYAVDSVETDAYRESIDWLVSKKNHDNGFGDADSTVYETALILNAFSEIKAFGIVDFDFEQSIKYIFDQQHESGSWEGSIYTTALVLQSIRSTSLPNIAVENLIQEPDTSISDGQLVQFKVDVVNDSRFSIAETVLDFYLGGSGSSVLLERVHIPSLPGLSKVTTSISWDTLDQAGLKNIYVLADADKNIVERSEQDNIDSISLTINPAPTNVELEISNQDILIQTNALDTLPVPLAINAVV